MVGGSADLQFGTLGSGFQSMRLFNFALSFLTFEFQLQPHRAAPSHETPWLLARLTIDSETNYSLGMERHAHLGFTGKVAGRESAD